MTLAPIRGTASLRLVSRAAMERLQRRASRPVRIALLGEFSAGKSTLLNLLVGQPLAVTQITATQVPTLRISRQRDRGAGPGRRWAVLEDGRRVPIDLERIHQQIPEGCRHVRVELPEIAAGDVELIDTPGISDPLMETFSVLPEAVHADAVLWCTPAAQAWRQSEFATWEVMPARLRERSILLVTRTDQISVHDLDRVLARLRRETGGLFRGVLAVSGKRAADARMERDRETSAAEWKESGGEALFSAVSEIVNRHRAEALDLLARYAVADDDGLELETGGGQAPAARSSAESPPSEAIAETLKVLEAIAKRQTKRSKNAMPSALFLKLRSSIGSNSKFTVDQKETLLALFSIQKGKSYDERRCAKQLHEELSAGDLWGWTEA